MGPGDISRQVVGELKGVAQEVVKGIAGAPGQILSQQLESSLPAADKDDQTGLALEKGQTVGDDTQAKKQISGSGQGWGDALKSQLGPQAQHQQTRQQLTEVRRNLTAEIESARRQREAAEKQKQEQAEQQKQAAKQHAEEQKQAAGRKKFSVNTMFGQGETRGAKGK